MSTNDPGQPGPEYVGSDSPAPEPPAGTGSRRGRRAGLLVAAVVAVAAVVGAGTWGALQLMSGGDAPASAVPSTALGYVSIDLDPSAAQKIEAFKILRKFPGLKKQLGIGSRDDIRRAVFEQFTKTSSCSSLDYDQDVKPWIGERLAVAAVPDAKKVALPLVVVQVGDQAKAKKGLATLRRCAGSGDQASHADGVSFVGDYMLVTGTQKQADAMAHAAGSATLADDADFKTWMGRVGDPGIVTMYASQDAPSAIIRGQKQLTGRLGTQNPAVALGSRSRQLPSMFKGFQGAAGVVRFKDGAVEAEVTSKGVRGATSSGAPAASTLPGTTAAALSVAFRDGWLDEFLDGMKGSAGAGAVQGMLRGAEAQTGLQLPQDLETLLGHGVSVSVDSGADLRSLSRSPDPTKIPAGIRIAGDETKIVPILDKLKAAAGPEGKLVVVKQGSGVVAVGTDPAYVGSLLAHGNLGDAKAFQDVVPHANRASSLLYVNFDAGGGWADRLADLASDGNPEVKANVAPLGALGISSWQDDDQVQHGLLRLTTD